MPQSLTVEIDLAHRWDTGDDAAARSTHTLSLAGFTVGTMKRSIALAPGAADQALTFTDATMIMIVSRDNPFSVRLAAGETLVGPGMFFMAGGTDEDSGVLQTSVLLTGNGSSTALLECWIVESE